MWGPKTEAKKSNAVEQRVPNPPSTEFTPSRTMVLSLWPAKEWTLLLSFIRWHDEHGGLLLNSRSNQEFIQNMVIEKIVHPFPMSFLESSGCVRYGVLSLEAGRCFGKDDIQVANYMQQFFNHMRMAIEVPELTDIIIGSFTLFLSASYQDNMHLQGIHYRGLTAAFAELIRGHRVSAMQRQSWLSSSTSQHSNTTRFRIGERLEGRC